MKHAFEVQHNFELRLKFVALFYSDNLLKDWLDEEHIDVLCYVIIAFNVSVKLKFFRFTLNKMFQFEI